jgi:hypothetical protein
VGFRSEHQHSDEQEADEHRATSRKPGESRPQTMVDECGEDRPSRREQSEPRSAEESHRGQPGQRGEGMALLIRAHYSGVWLRCAVHDVIVSEAWYQQYSG